MTNTITCGHCDQVLDGAIKHHVFHDCTLTVIICQHCGYQVVTAIAPEAVHLEKKRAAEYARFAEALNPLARRISDKQLGRAKRMEAVTSLRALLDRFATDITLADLTKLYLSAPSEQNVLGYQATAVMTFINAFKRRFALASDLMADLDAPAAEWFTLHPNAMTLTKEALAQGADRQPEPLATIASYVIEERRVLGMTDMNQVANYLFESDDDDRPFGDATTPAPTLDEVVQTATRMAQSYSASGDALVNFFRITPEMVPDAPTEAELAAFAFFKEHPSYQMVLPGPSDMHFFTDQSKRMQMLLAADAKVAVKVRTNSKLAYQLFMSQVARDIADDGLPGLAAITLISAPNPPVLDASTPLRFITYELDKKALPADKLTYDQWRLPSTTANSKTQQLEVSATIELPPLDQELIIYVLTYYQGHYQQSHHVSFETSAIEAIARGSRTILLDSPDPERALLLMDQVATEHAGTKSESVTITADMVQVTFARHYHSFPSAVLDQSVVRTLRSQLSDHVIGQEAAIDSVAKTMARAALGFNNPNRPLGSFLFAGPTGVGKTELAKQLALELYGDETQYVRLDMSEYANPEDGVYKLIGGAPQWKGSEQGGKLTNALAEHPNAIILFDEFEKADNTVHNLMLQVLDEGHITSGLGQIYSLKSNILIFTSNAGMTAMDGTVGFGGSQFQNYVFSADAFGETFPKELLNRFNSVVEFKPLQKGDLAKILELKLKRYYRLLQKRGITLTITDAAKSVIIDAGFDPEMGARPLERAIDNLLIDAIADLLMTEPDAQQLTADVDDAGQLTVINATPAAATDEKAVLFVSGAFNPHTNTYGYGAILQLDDQTTPLQGAASQDAWLPLRDFGGQLNGVLAGVQTAIDEAVPALTVVYDYQGVEKWATGLWQADKPASQAYRDQIQTLAQQIELHFRYERANASEQKQAAKQLAKAAVGLIESAD